MKVHVYAFSWNEAPLVPFFLRHYLPWADRVVVFDHSSDDGTKELLERHRVEVRSYTHEGYPEPEPMTRLRSTGWFESKRVADWVCVVDFDEFLWHPQGAPAYLERAYRAGYTCVRTFGWQMVAARFPPDYVDLTAWCRTGVPWSWYSKPCVFRPEQFEQFDFSQGAHEARPVGNARVLTSGSLATLHYKHLGVDHVIRRYEELRARLGPELLARYGHYTTPEGVREHHAELTARAVDVTL